MNASSVQELPHVSGADPAATGNHPDLAPIWLCLLAIAVGVITGIGAAVFRALIGLVHNILFLGELSFAYDSSLFTPASPWGIGIILVPVIGGIGVTFIVSTFAPEAKGHGVPEVMNAIYYGRGIIRPIVAVAKSLASALAIGSGAAVGREGPIIQIGSALGSTCGQIIRMSVAQRIILVASGAGAGIAATFNTPIGGVLFAAELMLPAVSATTFLPVALAVGMATFVGRLFFGDQPAFAVPAELGLMPAGLDGGAVLALYAILGALIGVAATGFIHGLHWAEDMFDRIPGRYTRHIIGMAMVGLLMWILMNTAGHYYVDGVGYDSIQATLTGSLGTAPFFLVLFFCKLLATSVSLGSGSSGGIFSPSLFMGATLGGAFAGLCSTIFPTLPISVPAFAMVGMGAMVGSGTGAVLTAIAMTFEMTLDYEVVLPMVIASAVALGIRRMMSTESIYTIKLVRRGRPIPKELHANMFLVRRAQEIMDRDIRVIDRSELLPTIEDVSDASARIGHVIVTDGAQIVAVTTGQGTAAARADDWLTTLVKSADPAFSIARANEPAFDVITRMAQERTKYALVVPDDGECHPERVIGVISSETIGRIVIDNISIYPA